LTASLLKPPTSSQTLGVVVPTRRLAPDRIRTVGPKAREFAAQAGLSCLPWQALVLDDWLARRRDGKWAARECGLAVARQNGKSICAVVRILAGLYLYREETIVYTAHQVDTALEIFERVIRRIDANPDLKRRMVGKPRRSRGSESITLRNPDQRLLIKARGSAGGRGFSGDLIFFDEAQMGLDEEDMAALGPTQRAMPNPQTIFMGTPPLKSGTYWALNVRARSFTGDRRLSWNEWSPPKSYDPDDREVWRLTNPAYGVLIDDEAIEQDRKNLGSKFDAEALGAWPAEKDDAGWEVFSELAWRDAQDPDTEIVGSPAFCVEVSRDLSTITIGAAGRNRAGKRHLEIAARFPADVGKLVGWLKKRRTLHQPSAVVVDPNGPAGYLVAEVERHYGEVTKPLGRDVAAACGSVYVGICGPEVDARDIKVRPHPALDAAARAAQWRDRGDARVFDRRDDDGPDVSPLMAVTLAAAAPAAAVPRSKVY
jgi:hypothetical protein